MAFGNGVALVCSQTIDGGISALDRAGTFVVVGFQPGSTIVLEPNHVLHEELVITGNRYASRQEIAASLTLVASGRVEPVIGLEVPLARLEDAFDASARTPCSAENLIDCSPA